MTERSDLFGRATSSLTGKTAAAARELSGLRSNQDVVFVDVGARAVESKVVRDGVPIGVLHIDPEVLQDVIIDRPVVAFRIVGQSVPPGTPVPQGTTVEVTLARPGSLPVGVVSGVHRDLAGRRVEEVFSAFVTPATRRVLARTAGGPLTAEDEQVVKDVFAQNRVEVGDEPGRDVGAALEALRMLSTFGGT